MSIIKMFESQIGHFKTLPQFIVSLKKTHLINFTQNSHIEYLTHMKFYEFFSF